MNEAIIETLKKLEAQRCHNSWGGFWVEQVAAHLPHQYCYSDVHLRRFLRQLVAAGLLEKPSGRRGYRLAANMILN